MPATLRQPAKAKPPRYPRVNVSNILPGDRLSGSLIEARSEPNAAAHSQQEISRAIKFYPKHFSRFVSSAEIDADLESQDEVRVLLAQLKQSGLPDACETIFELQSTPLPAALRVEAVVLLNRFARANLDSADEVVAAAIGAAIRKSLLNCDIDELEFAADLFDACAGKRQQLAVELEIAKMLVHRGMHEGDMATASLKSLRKGLRERAMQYCRKSEVEKDYVGATALNAALAIVYLRDDQAGELVKHLKKQSPTWFFDSFEHRLRRFVNSMSGNGDSGERRDPQLNRTVDFIRGLGLDIGDS